MWVAWAYHAVILSQNFKSIVFHVTRTLNIGELIATVKQLGFLLHIRIIRIVSHESESNLSLDF